MSVTEKLTVHGFNRFYESYLTELSKKKYANPTLIEIGVYEGKSIPYWRLQVPSWKYIGLDKSIQSITKDNIDCLQLDQGSEKELDLFVKNYKDNHNVLFINDDGSHVPDHQILTFNKLFPLLEDGGIYFLEDIETSYWTKGSLYELYTMNYGFHHPSSVIERFKDALDIINIEYLHEENRKSLRKRCEANGFDFEVLKTVRSIRFGPNFIAIEKQVQSDDKPFLNRDYRLKYCL
jgi:hypothetical protein